MPYKQIGGRIQTSLKISYLFGCYSQTYMSSYSSPKCFVERKQCHMVKLGLTLLSHASMLLTFWDHAFTTVIYLKNRLLTASLNFSVPYTVLFGHPPEYQHLKAFGCACFPFLRPYSSHKLEFRSHDVSF